jgi:hypothetical protein
VGHTKRPPHIRAKELSRTSWPTPFEVEFARFSWDAPKMERWVHRGLERACVRLRELFKVDLVRATNFLRLAPQSTTSNRPSAPLKVFCDDCPSSWRQPDPDWAFSLDGLQEQWGWGEEERHSRNQDTRNRGWARLYALSGQGWAEGSRRLGDALLANGSTDAVARAGWVYEAAEVQWLAGGDLRAAWLRSLYRPDALKSFQDIVSDWVTAQDAGRSLPLWVEETLLEEQKIWSTAPSLAFNPRAPSLPTSLRPGARM